MDFWDVGVVVAYLVITLVMGCWVGRGLSTVKGYATMEKPFALSTLYATIVATYVGGGNTIGVAEKAFRFGFIFPALYMWAGVTAVLMLAIFVAPRMGKFVNLISPGGIAYQLYGDRGELLTGICGVLRGLGIVSAQVLAIGFIFHEFLGIPPAIGTVIGSAVLVFYSAFGGARAVIITDVFHFWILIVAIPLIVFLALRSVGGVDILLSSVPETHLTIAPLWKEAGRYMPLVFLFFLPDLDPTMMQRLLMGGGDQRKLVKAFSMSAFTIFPVAFCVGTIGLCALASSPHIEPQFAMTHVIHTAMPVGLRGFIASGMLAVLMSTADSWLNVSGIMFVFDLVMPRTKSKLTEEQMVRYARWTTLALGTGAVFMALAFKSVIDLLLYANSFWVSVVYTPLLAGVMGYRGTVQAFTWAAVSGAVVVFLWTIFSLEARCNIYDFFPGMLVNVLVFFALSEYGKRRGVFEKEGKRYFSRLEAQRF